MDGAPIRYTGRQLTQGRATTLSRMFASLMTAMACLCGPKQPDPIVKLSEEEFDKNPLYE